MLESAFAANRTLYVIAHRLHPRKWHILLDIVSKKEYSAS
jgi:hypothetical protein